MDRSHFARWQFAATLSTLVLTSGCSWILGFEEGKPFPDGGNSSDSGAMADANTVGPCGAKYPDDTPFCAPEGCTSSCSGMTPTRCDTACVNLDSDANHCGDCTKQRPMPSGGGKPTCQ